MKKYRALLMIILAMVMLSGCSKNGPGAKDLEPTATAVGTNNGVAVTQNMGSTGGTIKSDDGEMELVIPAGALTSNTEITIQPITNTAPNGRRKAYRCTPDGLQFAKDIEVKFHYTDEDAAMTQPEYMQVAFQNDDGTWKVIEKVTNDIGGKTITASVNHFTDFSAFDILRLEPPQLQLAKGATGSFQISWAGMTTDNLVSFGVGVLQQPVVWKVNGETGGNNTVGNITATSPSAATYTAPNAEPPTNPVDVSAEINIPFTVDGQRFNKGILNGKVFIFGSRYQLTLEFSSESATGTGEVFRVQDNVRMTVNLSGSGGTVSGAINVPATFDQIQASTNGCTTSFISNGTGPINLRDIDLLEVARTGPGGAVYVSFDANTDCVPAKIQINCPGSTQTKDFLPWSSDGAILLFTDNGQAQTIDMSQTSNPSLKLYVIPLP